MSDAVRKAIRVVGLVLFAGLFLAGGVGHLIAPAPYLRIMPPYLPQPLALVYLSGVAEILLGGLLLIPATRRLAAWGLIALLVAVFPANYSMWQHAERFAEFPPILLLIRLPLQALLIAWAWSYTRAASTSAAERTATATAPAFLALSLLIGWTGCGFAGASLARLDRGSLVEARSPAMESIPVFFAKSEETVAPGTELRVVSDDEGTLNQVDRRVIVTFLSGPHQSLAGLMRRGDLRPAPRRE